MPTGGCEKTAAGTSSWSGERGAGPEPEGYTLRDSAPTLTISVARAPAQTHYDPEKDFAPIALLVGLVRWVVGSVAPDASLLCLAEHLAVDQRVASRSDGQPHPVEVSRLKCSPDAVGDGDLVHVG